MTFPDLLQIFSPKERLSKNPHYALRHDSFFLDAENHAHYRKYGWVKIRQTVRDNEIDSFMGAYLEISRLKGFELGPQFLNTGCLHNPEIRTKTQCVIRENVETILPRMFDMDKVEMRTGGSFVIKPPHIESALAPHQDSSFIDETKDYSLFMWVPFCNVHEDNGPIWVLPGSHLWGNIQRGFGVPWNLVKHVSAMREYMHPVYLEKGDVLIFDPALVHASGVNRSQDVRHAITITVARKNAQLIHYYQDADTKPGSIERYYVDETFFNEYDFSSRPDDGKWKKDTVDHQTFELTEKEVIKLIKEFLPE